MSALSGVTKAAVLLISVDEETRSNILRSLSEEEVEIVGREIALLPPIPASEMKAVFAEFEQMNSARSVALLGGVDCARTMITSAFGSGGLSMVARILKSHGSDNGSLEVLQKSDPRQLSKLIYNEHPQVIALILSHLAPAQAASLLNALPPEIRAEVTKRMAQIDQFSPQIVEQIATYVGQRLKAPGESSRKSYGGVRAVAEMMNRLNKDASDELLAAISLENEALSTTVRELMFVFEDIRSLDKEDIKALLNKVDRKILTIALKGSTPDLRTHFTQCMSSKAAEMFTEDIDALGPVRIRDLEAARGQVISTVRQLQAEGVIGTKDSGDGYVT
jgi:flagellar motor switch protein FliG